MPITTATLFGLIAMNRRSTSDYVDWAIGRLLEGDDSLNLRILAGLDAHRSLFETEEHFHRALRELGVSEPDEAGKLRAYAVELAQRILAGSVKPEEGVNRLSRVWVASDYDSRYQVWDALDSSWSDLWSGEFPYSYPTAKAENFAEVVASEARQFLEDVASVKGAMK